MWLQNILPSPGGRAHSLFRVAEQKGVKGLCSGMQSLDWSMRNEWSCSAPFCAKAASLNVHRVSSIKSQVLPQQSILRWGVGGIHSLQVLLQIKYRQSLYHRPPGGKYVPPRAEFLSFSQAVVGQDDRFPQQHFPASLKGPQGAPRSVQICNSSSESWTYPGSFCGNA